MGGALLDLVQVESQPEQLRVPVASPDDLVEPVGAAGEVAGAQLAERGAAGQVGRAFGVPHHHVGPGVDELAGVGVRALGGRFETERAARDRNPDRLGPAGRESRRQVGHPCRRLGLAVHHDEVPAVTPAELGVAAHQARSEPAARLGDVAQRRDVPVLEAGPVQQVERVGHPGEGRRSGVGEEVPEALVDHRQVGEDQAGAADQVAVDHGEPVAVVHRQRGRGAVCGGQPEVRRDARARCCARCRATGGPASANRWTRRCSAGARDPGAAGERCPDVAG